MNTMTPSCVADTEDLSNLKMDIVLAGVGGQGTLVAGKLLGIAAMKLGLDVKVSEVHGMSQRGGSVITYVRIGKKVFSPIVENGTADVCLAFEELEALRWSALLKKGGTMIINSQQIRPLPVLLGNAQYPQGITDALRTASSDHAKIAAIDALDCAAKAGSSRAVNMVMIGAMSFYTRIPVSIWEEAIAEVFAQKEKLIPANIRAFHFGRDLMG